MTELMMERAMEELEHEAMSSSSDTVAASVASMSSDSSSIISDNKGHQEPTWLTLTSGWMDWTSVVSWASSCLAMRTRRWIPTTMVCILTGLYFSEYWSEVFFGLKRISTSLTRPWASRNVLVTLHSL